MGLRRSEIASLPKSAHIGKTLRVTGKGAKTRELPLDDLTDSILTKLAAENPESLFFFPGQKTAHAHPASIYKWAKALLGPQWALHSCRRRAGTKGYEETGDIVAVQLFLGHSHVNTTMIYVNINLARVAAVTRANSFIHVKSMRNIAGLPASQQPKPDDQLDFLSLVSQVSVMARTRGLEIHLKPAA